MRRVVPLLVLTALLPVAVFWYGCRVQEASCAPDGYEPNDSLGACALLGDVPEGGGEQSWTATISESGDADFFEIHAEEVSQICMPGTPESFAFRVRLVPPQGLDCRNYDLYVYDDKDNLLDSSTNDGCAEETVTLSWDGICELDDSLGFRVEVRPVAGAYSCSTYTLYAQMWEP